MKSFLQFVTIFSCLCLSYKNCFASSETQGEITDSLDNKNIESAAPRHPELDSGSREVKTPLTTEILNQVQDDLSLTPGPLLYKRKAKIIILNKITAKSELVEFKIGETKYFGNLSVEVQKCVKNTDPLSSSSLMLFSIFDNKPDDDRISVFQGWMDSANLSISTVEHPIYEIIPKECVD